MSTGVCTYTLQEIAFKKSPQTDDHEVQVHKFKYCAQQIMMKFKNIGNKSLM